MRGADPASALCKPSQSEEIWSRGLGRVKASGGGPGLPEQGEAPTEPGPPGRGGFPAGAGRLEPSTTLRSAAPGPVLAALAPSPLEDGTKKSVSSGGETILFSPLSPRNTGRPQPAAAHPPSRPPNAASTAVLRGRGPLPPCSCGRGTGEDEDRGPPQEKPRGHAGSGSVPPLPSVPTHGPAVTRVSPARVCVRLASFLPFFFFFKTLKCVKRQI